MIFIPKLDNKKKSVVIFIISAFFYTLHLTSDLLFSRIRRKDSQLRLQRIYNESTVGFYQLAKCSRQVIKVCFNAK